MDDLLLSLRNVSKTYGATKALNNVSLDIHRGEIYCLIGANGAGKSTLMRVISGVTRPDSGGEIVFDGEKIVNNTAKNGNKLGIRVVHQELSLCTNLSVIENFYVDQYGLAGKGLNWRSLMEKRSKEALESIFPGSNIDVRTPISRFSISNRQMIEICRAASMDGLKLLILDEPTSSLGERETDKLISYLKKLKTQGVSIIFISHRLSEVIHLADRIGVLRNGEKIWEENNDSLTEQDLVRVMSESGEDISAGKNLQKLEALNRDIAIEAEKHSTKHLHDISCSIYGGELIGIAGLDGNGQREFLRDIFFSRGKSGIRRKGSVCYVTGDRRKEGIFPLSDISDNMTVVDINKSSFFSKLDMKHLSGSVSEWCQKLHVKAEGPDALITSLSGGNQQKVLVARSLLSDSDIIILDDPTKGVDIDTKVQMARLFREAAASGKLVIWYSSEDDELTWCSRVLVFRYGHIIDELKENEGSSILKDDIIAASFGGEDLLDKSSNEAKRRRGLRSPIIVPLLALVAVFMLCGILQPTVFSPFGIELLLSGSVPLICAALAQMFVIGLSQIDLGVGTFMGMVNVIIAMIMVESFWLGLLMIAVSVIAYAAVGFLIFKRQVPAVIVTMGMSYVWLGIAYTINERPGGICPEWLSSIFMADLPVSPYLLAIIICFLVAFLIYRSRYGVVLRGVGNNVTAMENSGWSASKAFAAGYAIAAAFSLVGGFAITASMGGCDANATESYTLLTVAAVVVGGSELVGGIAYPSGTVIGAITLSIISALLGFMRLDASWVTAVQGFILIVILASRLLRRAEA